MCREHRVGRDLSCCTAFGAGHLDVIALHLDLVVRVLSFHNVVGEGLTSIGVTAAIDLALCIKIAHNVCDNVNYLRIGQIVLVAVKTAKILNAVLLKHIKQLKLGAGKLRLDLIHLSHKADVDVGIGTGQEKNVLAKEKRLVHGKAAAAINFALLVISYCN